jgi:hypothetical protein
MRELTPRARSRGRGRPRATPELRGPGLCLWRWLARRWAADDALTAAAAVLARAPPALRPAPRCSRSCTPRSARRRSPRCCAWRRPAWLAQRTPCSRCHSSLHCSPPGLHRRAARLDRMLWQRTQAAAPARGPCWSRRPPAAHADARRWRSPPDGVPEAIDGTPLSIDTGAIVLDTDCCRGVRHAGRAGADRTAVVLEAAGPRVMNAGASTACRPC